MRGSGAPLQSTDEIIRAGRAAGRCFRHNQPMAARDSRYDLPPDFRRQPLRVSAVAGLAVATGASFLPWIQGTSGFGGPVSINGFIHSADGGFFLVFGLVLTFLVMSRWAAEGSAVALRVLPGVVGIVLVLLLVTAHSNAAAEIRAVEFEGGEAAVTPFLWLASGGVVLMAAAGVGLTVVDRLRRGPWLRAGDLRSALRRQNVVPLVSAIVGAMAGFVGVLALGAQTLESALVLAFVVAALIGGIVGGWLGYKVGHWLVLTPPDRRR